MAVIVAVLCCTLATLAGSVSDAPMRPIRLTQDGTTGREAAVVLRKKFGIPIVWPGASPHRFNLAIDESSVPAALAAFSAQAWGQIVPDVDEPVVHFEPAKREPLIRVDLQGGSVLLVHSIERARSIRAGVFATSTIAIGGALLTDPRQNIVAVAKSVDVTRVKQGDAWQLANTDRDVMLTRGSRIAWPSFTRITPVVDGPVNGVQGVLRVWEAGDRTHLVIDNPLTASDTVRANGLECQITPAGKQSDPTFTLIGPAIETLAGVASNRDTFDIVSVFNHFDEPIEAKIDSSFINGALVVRVHAAADKWPEIVIKFSVPTKLKAKLIPVTIDPLP